MLASHPEVSSSQETHLMTYIAALDAVWERHGRSNRRIGLPFVIGEEAFDDLEREFCRKVFRTVAQTPLFLEKTPGHVLYADRILHLFPEARFIHLIRDPRAAVSSILKAGRNWAGGWASRDSRANALLWRRSVEAGLALEAREPARTLTVGFAELRRSTAKELAAILDWLGLATSEELVAGIVEANSLEKVTSGADRDRPFAMSAEPGSFYGKGEVAGWANELTRLQIADIEEICHDLMVPLGFGPTASSAQRRLVRYRSRARDGWDRRLGAFAARLRFVP